MYINMMNQSEKKRNVRVAEWIMDFQVLCQLIKMI